MVAWLRGMVGGLVAGLVVAGLGAVVVVMVDVDHFVLGTIRGGAITRGRGTVT